MLPDDIPTEITKLAYADHRDLVRAGMPVLSQNQTAAVLAAYWPAIRAHFLVEGAELIGTASEQRLDEIPEYEQEPRHWERHHAWLDAANVLKKAAGAGQ